MMAGNKCTALPSEIETVTFTGDRSASFMPLGLGSARFTGQYYIFRFSPFQPVVNPPDKDFYKPTVMTWSFGEAERLANFKRVQAKKAKRYEQPGHSQAR